MGGRARRSDRRRTGRRSDADGDPSSPSAPVGVSAVVYDAGALIAADRNERAFWAEHRLRLEADLVPVVPAPVVVQVSRSPQQVQLRRLLRGCDVVDLTEDRAHAAGELLGRAAGNDVV